MITSLRFLSITEIKQERWDAIVGDLPYMSHAYLAALEPLDHNKKYYLILHDETKDVACAYFTLMRTTLNLPMVLRWVRKVYPNFFRMHVLECGPPGVPGPGIVGDITPDVLDAVASSIILMQNFYMIPLAVIRDFRDPHSILDQYGFQFVPNTEDTELDIHWSSFDAYLRALKSHYRALVRKDLDKAQELSVEITPHFEHYAEDLARIGRKAGKDIDAEFFHRLSSVDAAHVVLFRCRSRLVGFALYLRSKTGLYLVCLGVDPEADQLLPVSQYAYYMLVKIAIDNRVDVLHLGDVCASKLRVGARKVPLSMYMRYAWAPLTKVIAWITKKAVPVRRFKELQIWSR